MLVADQRPLLAPISERLRPKFPVNELASLDLRKALWRQFAGRHQKMCMAADNALLGAIPHLRIIAVDCPINRYAVPVSNALGKVTHHLDFLLFRESMRQCHDELMCQPCILP
ncbi:hypothetical protein D3C80_1914590 [compost metagenome]